MYVKEVTVENQDTVSVICNQLYWIYMTNALSVSEYWKEEVCV